MNITTSNRDPIQPFLKKLYTPPENSHKGQNGKVLIIGGSELFHASPIWAAEISSYFVDMVHFASTKENNEIVANLKTQFRNGIVVPQKEIESYIQEDDAVLAGPGMVRSEVADYELGVTSYEEILKTEDEAEFTYRLTHYLLKNFPQKKFVLDAGALQMMEPEWLTDRKTSPILTPHQLEFERLFGISVNDMSLEEKQETVKRVAAKYNCTIILKAVSDIISDGKEVFVVQGGNQGLTKGGTGDVLAGLIVSLYAKNDPVVSAVVASFIEKKAAEKLSETKGYWYNVADLIETIPTILEELIYN